MNTGINAQALDRFKALLEIEVPSMFCIVGSEEPEGVVKFREVSFYYAMNPMTPDWNIDIFEEYDETLGNKLKFQKGGESAAKHLLTLIP